MSIYSNFYRFGHFCDKLLGLVTRDFRKDFLTGFLTSSSNQSFPYGIPSGHDHCLHLSTCLVLCPVSCGLFVVAVVRVLSRSALPDWHLILPAVGNMGAWWLSPKSFCGNGPRPIRGTSLEGSCQLLAFLPLKVQSLWLHGTTLKGHSSRAPCGFGPALVEIPSHFTSPLSLISFLSML